MVVGCSVVVSAAVAVLSKVANVLDCSVVVVVVAVSASIPLLLPLLVSLVVVIGS